MSSLSSRGGHTVTFDKADRRTHLIVDSFSLLSSLLCDLFSWFVATSQPQFALCRALSISNRSVTVRERTSQLELVRSYAVISISISFSSVITTPLCRTADSSSSVCLSR